jgi:7-cyano-7-deazaguanine synthase in queuosine biosynthesis
MRPAMLWSGGFDSTVMLAHLASQGIKVQPYYISIRGGGKTAREKGVIATLEPLLQERFPSILSTIFDVKKIRAKESVGGVEVFNRNQRMIERIRDTFNETYVALGSYKSSRIDDDNNAEALSHATGINVLTFDNLNATTKAQIGLLGRTAGIEDLLPMTWSCQRWFKIECYERMEAGKNGGICYSCREKKEALNYLAAH